MHSRKRAGFEDGGRTSSGRRETVVSKTGRRKGTQGGAKNLKTGSEWEESVLEKWRGALVKARLALHKKREKKKEQHVKLAMLRKMADAARKPQEEDEEVPQAPPPKRKRGRPPLAAKARNAEQVSAAAVATESEKVRKKARTTLRQSQAHDGDLSNESIPSVTKVKRGRKASSIIIATDREETDHGAKLRAKMERREEIRNKLRKGLEIARSALKLKRERRKEKAQKAAITRFQRSQDEAVQDNTAQVVFSLRRPSLEELREFARKSRC